MASARNLRSALAVAISIALGASRLHAATITVSSADDDFHSSNCNLRNAITSLREGNAPSRCVATGNFGDNDTILFAPELANSTITLERGELTVASSMNIVGTGQIIDADYGSRVLYVSRATLTASDLTLTHGYAGGVARDGNGGGMYIYDGTVTLNSVMVSHNASVAEGGGIQLSAGALSLSHSTVSHNVSSLATGGLSIYGTATISDSVIANNVGATTGGIVVYSGYSGGDGYGSTLSSVVTITRSTIDSNSAICPAGPCVGGIYDAFGNFVTISESTISNNSATANADDVAGGIYAYDSRLTITNSTIASNSASGNNRVTGGVWHTGTDYGQSLLLNSTVSANSSVTLNASANVGSGVLLGLLGDSKFQLSNSIIAGNANGTDFVASGTSETMSSCVVGMIADIPPFNTDHTNHFTDTPGLGSLQRNGGPTETMALLSTSIAIDAGNTALTPSNYDQRGAGFARVFNGKIDIGAVEFQGDTIFDSSFEPGP